MTTKRKRGLDEDQKDSVDHDLNVQQDEHELETPTKRRRGRPPGSAKQKTPRNNGKTHGTVSAGSTHKGKGKLLFTDAKPRSRGKGEAIVEEDPLSLAPARGKSSPSKHATVPSTDEVDHDEFLVAGETLEEDLGEHSNGGIDTDTDDGPPAASSQPITPSKRQRKTSRRKAKSPTPPTNLPPCEQYFFQTQAKNAKTSNNTISSLNLLTHSDYHDTISKYKDPHESSIRFLHTLHSRSRPQWRFELSQKFSVCLYGYGSKRRLVTNFAKYLYGHPLSSEPSKIVIVNGYIPNLTFRQVLTTLATAVYEVPAPLLPINIGTQHRETIANLISFLDSNPPKYCIYLLINSLDAAPLRRSPIPSLLAQLASSSHISLLATCDTPNFPLLWDNAILEQYNFVFHDTTTFVSYGDVEIPSVIDDVNELLGRSGRAVKGKEGVGFVLRSLPENARNLYRVLVAEILTMMAEGDDLGTAYEAGDHDNEDEAGGKTHGGGNIGIDYRVLYQKAVDDFICSSDMAFRTLLKEFHDHQMVVLKRDGLGGEVLSVPFRKEEMETILEDLVA